MARNARDVLSFSDHWFRLVREVADNKRVVPIDYTNDADYRAIMNEFYGFRKALKANPEFQDVYRKAGQIKSYRENGMIHFHHVNVGRYAHLLLKALGPEEEKPIQVEPETQTQIDQSDFVDNASDTVIIMDKYFNRGVG